MDYLVISMRVCIFPTKWNFQKHIQLWDHNTITQGKYNLPLKEKIYTSWRTFPRPPSHLKKDSIERRWVMTSKLRLQGLKNRIDVFWDITGMDRSCSYMYFFILPLHTRMCDIGSVHIPCDSNPVPGVFLNSL